jgi:hypothetical protein
MYGPDDPHDCPECGDACDCGFAPDDCGLCCDCFAEHEQDDDSLEDDDLITDEDEDLDE